MYFWPRGQVIALAGREGGKPQRARALCASDISTFRPLSA